MTTLTHGHGRAGRRTRTYHTWQSMVARCTRPSHKFYPQYGGRGISVCTRWRAFVCFLADMGEAPPGMSLDRIDNDGDYERNNCRWADAVTQQNNRSSIRLVVLDGEPMSVAAAARKCGMGQQTFRSRLNRGWPIERAASEPIERRP